VFLTHFYPIAFGLEKMTVSDLQFASGRGGGIICIPGEAKFDAIVPLRILSRDGKIEFGWPMIGIQFKNTKDSLGSGPQLALDHSPLTVLPKGHPLRNIQGLSFS
jgi:hypothetical protein